ncbi:ParB/RepB/Spo0J family partition protein [Ochrobactrum soli]|uniref:ParB/RepB/Spo0J family partition protein n=1 Tax=Ochrobactrum soli TaxID=2448455 RepID=A0A849KZY0_9HYPH|nr:ParB/RepB/Spo0J family partition protein [[Ochrobactrum] soli]NNU63362.1 ParB/RepB/Spo0J family partition protein [[Ochrobactrum] soli]
MSGILEGIDFSGFEKVAKNQTEAPAKQEPVGGQVELSLADVIEDPEQPRRSFDQASLQELAESIKKRGVVQPIVVRPKNADGKYVIVMGARRYRASHLANVSKIPAVIRVKPSDGYDQMIENIQRENLLHADIARFIEQELAKGTKPASIATSLGKPRSWVSLYTGFSQMHDAVRDRVEELGIRVAYELQKAMEIDEAATLAYIESNEAITQRGAMALAKSLKGDSSFESGPSAPETETVEPSSAEAANGALHAGSAAPTDEQPVGGSTANEAASPKRRSSPVAIIVQVNERAGRLMTDRAAEQGSQYGVVSFDNGANIEEVALSDIRLLEIMLIE